jgi:RHS repeat-associated protein
MICSDGLLNINGSTTNYEFHLKDHLGNTRVAVNETNDITQESNYYPFGLTFAQSGSSTNKYLYNGKEKQEETEWLAYGNRFYDAYIGRFFNQDRFAEKYVEMSPYQYAANNSIKFIDVNGDSLWINYDGNRILYIDGGLYNKDGSDYLGAGVKRDKKGNVKLKGFLKSVVDDLRTIGSKKDGARMLSDIQDSYFSVDIVKNNKTKFSGYTSDAKILPFGEANTGSSSTIFFNRYGETSGPDSEGNTYVDSFITLSHELGHAWDASEGLLDLRPYSRAANGDIITCSELFATHYENRIRSEHKKPLRKYYDYDFTKNTGNLRLINGTKSLFYNWDYKTGMTL